MRWWHGFLPRSASVCHSAPSPPGVIPDGAQLPSEIDLATQLGVSTMTLREALAILRAQGLVVTKRGRGGGSFVRASAEDVHTRALALLQEFTVEGLRDLGDEQFAVAGATAVLAARRAVAADIARLRKLADRLAVSEDAITGRRADSLFHLVADQGHAPDEASRHHQLVDAIEAEDQTGARSLAEEHSTSIIRRLIALRMELARL